MNAAKQEKSLARRLALPVVGGALAGFSATFLFLNVMHGERMPSVGLSPEIAAPSS